MNKIMRKITVVFLFVTLFTGCERNPFTGKLTMDFVDDKQLLAESFSSYREFVSVNDEYVIDDTPDGKIVAEVGEDLRTAAEKWLVSMGKEEYLNSYEWEYHLVSTDEVNAWCMPGGKIVVYTGILSIAYNRAGLATVMGHELAHALLNHSRQGQSAEILKTLGAIALTIATNEEDYDTQQTADAVYSIGSTLLGTLPFSRKHESEADEIGLILMTIAGYDPDEAVAFWTRMSEASDGLDFEFLSTHPADNNRIKKISENITKSKEIAAEIAGK